MGDWNLLSARAIRLRRQGERRISVGQKQHHWPPSAEHATRRGFVGDQMPSLGGLRLCRRKWALCTAGVSRSGAATRVDKEQER